MACSAVGVIGDVSGGVSGGVRGGVRRGVSGGIHVSKFEVEVSVEFGPCK